MKVDRTKLMEASIADAVANKAADGEIHASDELDEVIADCISISKRQHRLRRNHQEHMESINLLLVGQAGAGKSAIIKALSKQGLNVVTKQLSSFDITDVGGAVTLDPNTDKGLYVTKAATREFNSLDQPNSVLFLDELARAEGTIRGTMLTMINDHVLPDSNFPNGERYFPNLLFTVAAMNPPGGIYDGEVLDIAELSRFFIVQVASSKTRTQTYLVTRYQDDLAQNEADYAAGEIDEDEYLESKAEAEGKLNIMNRLLSSNQFEFDNTDAEQTAYNDQTNILSARTLSKCLEWSRGNVTKFLKYWKGQCGPNTYAMVKEILKDFQSKNDKANSVFKSREKTDADVLGDWLKAN